MLAAATVLSLLCAAPFSGSNAAVVEVPITPIASFDQKEEAHIGEGEEEEEEGQSALERIALGPAREDFTACSGSAEKPLQLNSCYLGTKMGETVMVKVNDFDTESRAGSVYVTGKGLSSVRCNKGFSVKDQVLKVIGIQDCLPGRVKPKTMKYCSDQDHVILGAHVNNHEFEMVLLQTECPSEFLSDMSHLPGSALLQKSWAWTAGTCTGEAAPPAHANSCYAGTKLGEAITMKMHSFDPDQSTGSLLVTGSGMSHAKCSRDFAKSGQLLNVSDLQHCLQSTVKAHGLRYCSDQDHIILDAAVGPMSVEMLLQPSPCPSVLLQEEVATDNLLSHSAWVWDSDDCTGFGSPPAQSPFCFTGSKMGEVVSIKVKDFDSDSLLGSVLVTGSGMFGKLRKCEKPFNIVKAQQLINVPKLHECLPKTVQPNGMRYCSDQNKVLLTAHVGIIPVQMELIPAACPAVLLEEDAKASSLIQTEWDWASTTCTGVKDPLASTDKPTCYSGNKMGQHVAIKVHSFDTPSGSGSVFVTGSGLARIRCERSFLKAQQMITVSKLHECLPSTVNPSGLKYCSDQDKIILDATVAHFPVEMVLTPSPCPSAFLEESHSDNSLVQGEIFASGAQRVMRSVK